MSEKTVRTCPSCGHEGEIKGRRVVVCDQCGRQADMIRSPYTQSLTSPSAWAGGTWTGGFYYRNGAAPDGRRSVDSRDFCGQECRAEYEQAHERAVMRA